MLKIKSTPRLSGIEINGDRDDLAELSDAILFLIGNEDDYPGYESARIKLLELCRKLKLAANCKPTQNGGCDIYVCRCLWPDALFDISAISDYLFLYGGNEFYLKNRRAIKRYSYEESERKAEKSYDYVDYIRFFQGAVRNELRRTIGKARFSQFASTYLYHQIFSGVTKHYEYYAVQYIDTLNSRYVKTEIKKRPQALSDMFADILNRNLHHDRYCSMIVSQAENVGVPPHKYIPKKLKYPENIEW